MLMHLFKFARRYHLRHDDNEPVAMEALINLRTRGPLYMRLEPRN
jgi:hypothetical protein